MTPQEFNARYWGAQSAAVQTLSGMESFSAERMAKAIELATKGELIDGEVMARGTDPWHTMKLREGYGYTWVPSLLQPPVPVAPGIVFPGAPIYDATKVPVGAVKVSSKAEDYPPIVALKPEPVIEGVPAEPLWSQVFGDWAPVQALDNSPDGAVYAGPKGRWVKHVINTPFGKSGWWSKIG